MRRAHTGVLKEKYSGWFHSPAKLVYRSEYAFDELRILQILRMASPASLCYVNKAAAVGVERFMT